MRSVIKFIMFSLLISLTSCDNIKQNYNDILKYPEIKPFIIDSINFKGNLNIDNSKLNFNFTVSYPHPLPKIDSIAKAEDWILIYSIGESRTYVKNIKNYPVDFRVDTLNVEYDEKKSKLLFFLY